MDVFPSEVYPSIDAIDHSPGTVKMLCCSGIKVRCLISNRLDLVAQLVEHWTGKPWVVGSIPTVVKQFLSLPGVDIHILRV